MVGGKNQKLDFIKREKTVGSGISETSPGPETNASEPRGLLHGGEKKKARSKRKYTEHEGSRI